MNQLYTERNLSKFYQAVIAKQSSFLIKVSTDVLTMGTDYINRLKLDDIVNQTARLHENGKKVAIVSSGARQAGQREMQQSYDLSKSVGLGQALAGIGQPDLMGDYRDQFRKYNLQRGQILLEYDHFQSSDKIQKIKDGLEWYPKLNAIPIFNENDPVSTDEIEPELGSTTGRIGDNDVLSVMVAKTFGYNVIYMITGKDGFLENGSGNKFHVVDETNSLWDHVTDEKSSRTRGGMRSKLTAISDAMDHGIYVVLLSGKTDSVIDRTLGGEPLGTLFLPKNYKKESER